MYESETPTQTYKHDTDK